MLSNLSNAKYETGVDFEGSVRLWFKQFFSLGDLLDKQFIADNHDLIYLHNDDAFVFDLMDHLPNRKSKIILEAKLSMDLTEFFENNLDSAIFKIVEPIVRHLSNQLDININFYHKNSYIGISAKDLKLTSRSIIYNFDLLIDRYTNLFLCYIDEKKYIDKSRLLSLEDEDYFDEILTNFIEDNFDYYDQYVCIPVLHHFRVKIERIISEFTPEKWVENLGPIVQDYLQHKT